MLGININMEKGLLTIAHTHGISNILFEDLVILKTTKMLLIRNASIFRVFSYAGCVDYGLLKT